MRWERLFQELESQSHDVYVTQRESDMTELVWSQWSSAPWSHVVHGSQVRVHLPDSLLLSGLVSQIAQDFFALEHDAGVSLISWTHVRGIEIDEFLIEPLKPSPWKWGHVFRFAQRERAVLRVRTCDGQLLESAVAVIGHDFVGVSNSRQRKMLIPYSAIMSVTQPR